MLMSQLGSASRIIAKQKYDVNTFFIYFLQKRFLRFIKGKWAK